MHTKTLGVNINWLDAIDGLAVSDAIEYLLTLDQGHTLSYSMEGDTHGCTIESRLTYEVPKSNSEIFADLEKRYMGKISFFKEAKLKHLA